MGVGVGVGVGVGAAVGFAVGVAVADAVGETRRIGSSVSVQAADSKQTIKIARAHLLMYISIA